MASNTNSTSTYYDVIVNRAAKKAGVQVNPTGSPSINGPTEAQIYNNEIQRIKGTFWCQTGGWSKLPDNGKTGCLRTAAATMASINSGINVTPNDTEDSLSSIKVNGTKYDWKDGGAYSSQSGAAQGITLYDFNSESAMINAINNELKNNRAVVVKTTVSGQHWVTVTGTKNGKPATSFSDLVGVDPWYNGGNANNPSTATGTGANNSTYSGVITLSSVPNQKAHSDYKIFTFKV